jgi:hypothetical protein
VNSKRRAYLSMLRRRVLELLGRGFDVYVLAEYRGIVGGELLPAIACSFAPLVSADVVVYYARYFSRLAKCSSSANYYLLDHPRVHPGLLDKPALVITNELPESSNNVAVVELNAKKALELQQQGYRVYYLSLE